MLSAGELPEPLANRLDVERMGLDQAQQLVGYGGGDEPETGCHGQHGLCIGAPSARPRMARARHF